MRALIEKQVDAVRRELLVALDRGDSLVLVEAPPGSGKTRLIIDAAALVRSRGLRVAIAAQTNSQRPTTSAGGSERTSHNSRWCASPAPATSPKTSGPR